ncbi:gag-pol polyprotein [Tanacetum coccineum]
MAHEKLNALKFVPQQELSREQAYWLPANEIASQASNPNSPVTPFVQIDPPPIKFCFIFKRLMLFFINYEDTSSASNAIFEINKLRKQLQGKDDTIRNLDAQINIMKVLNEGSTESSCDQQALETDRIQLKDTITSLRIQLDGLKVENVSLKRRYDELSKANTHSRTVYTEKLSALTTQHTKLQAQVTGKTSSGPSTSETPKVLAPGMYNLGSKYIPPPKRANWVKTTPLHAKKQVTFSEPPRPSLKPTQKPVVHPNKQTNVCVPMSTGVKPTSGASKTVPKRAPRNHSSLPVKSANARRVEAHHRILNKKNRVDSNLLVKHSVSVSDLNNVCGACNKSLVFANHSDCLVICDGSVNVKPHQTKRFTRQPKKEWKPIKRVWKQISKPVANSKPQWKPTGRHFSLFEKHPLTRIMESTDPRAGSKGISGSTNCSMVSGFWKLNTSPYQDAVLKSSGCVLNSGTMDLRSMNMQQSLAMVIINWVTLSSPEPIMLKDSSTTYSHFTSLLAYKSLSTKSPGLWHRSVESSEILDIERIGSGKIKKKNTNTEVLHNSTYGPLRTNENGKYQWKEVCFGDSGMMYTRFGCSSAQIMERGESRYRYLCWLCTAPKKVRTGIYNKPNAKIQETVSWVPSIDLPRIDVEAVLTLVKDPEHLVSSYKETVEHCFQWFDDDEVVPIPPVVPITPVNVPAAPAPENANDTSDSDVETLFDHVDSNVFDTYNAPETDSEASPSNSVNIDVTPNNQLPHVQKWTQSHPLETLLGYKTDPPLPKETLETDAMLSSESWYDFEESLLRFARLESISTHHCYTRQVEHGHLPDGLKTAFLNGELNEVVYVSQPEGFVDPEHPSHVYRLKESSLWTQTSSTCVEILKKFGFDSCTPIDTPMAERPNLDEDKGGKLIDPTRFRLLAKPTEMHLTAIKRIFRYLKGTIHMGLWYPKDAGFELKAFAELTMQDVMTQMRLNTSPHPNDVVPNSLMRFSTARLWICGSKQIRCIVTINKCFYCSYAVLGSLALNDRGTYCSADSFAGKIDTPTRLQLQDRLPVSFLLGKDVVPPMVFYEMLMPGLRTAPLVKMDFHKYSVQVWNVPKALPIIRIYFKTSSEAF